MGGIFGVVSKSDCVMDIFFGTDYHSHLGTKRGGMCILEKNGFNRAIHNIENNPFRSKFEAEIEEMDGLAGIGSISDGEPQPLTVTSRYGDFSITTVGRINNKKALVEEILQRTGGHFMSMSKGVINNTELVAAIVASGDSLLDGIRLAQEKIDGSCTMLVLTDKGELYAARDKLGRTPLIIGHKEDAICAASESFAFINLGYELKRELGPGEVAYITAEKDETLIPPGEEMRVCTFLWTYFGYTPSVYEGRNVELMRNINGESMAKQDGPMDIDYVAGVPDSGIAHAIGYSNASNKRYARPLIKYTPTWPRSFMPQNQKARNVIAKMKLIPVLKLIKGKKFVLIDDSIVRGTQLAETVNYLTDNGAEKIHVRSACPPIMYGCKYLNFSRSVSDMELLSRRCIRELEGLGGEADANPNKLGEAVQVSPEVLKEYADANSERYQKMVELMREKLGFDSLKFQTLEELLKATNLEPCTLCTYCWNGKE